MLTGNMFLIVGTVSFGFSMAILRNPHGVPSLAFFLSFVGMISGFIAIHLFMEEQTHHLSPGPFPFIASLATVLLNMIWMNKALQTGGMPLRLFFY